MFGRKAKTPPIDIRRVVSVAVETAFGENGAGSREARQNSDQRHDHRLGGAGAVATGVVIATVARAAYKRAMRNMPLERVAEAVERRLQGPSG